MWELKESWRRSWSKAKGGRIGRTCRLRSLLTVCIKLWSKIKKLRSVIYPLLSLYRSPVCEGLPPSHGKRAFTSLPLPSVPPCFRLHLVYSKTHRCWESQLVRDERWAIISLMAVEKRTDEGARQLGRKERGEEEEEEGGRRGGELTCD